MFQGCKRLTRLKLCNLSDRNTDGSITTAISNSFFGPLQKNPVASDIIVYRIISGDFHFYSDNCMLCVLIRIASIRTHNILLC